MQTAYVHGLLRFCQLLVSHLLGNGNACVADRHFYRTDQRLQAEQSRLDGAEIGHIR